MKLGIRRRIVLALVLLALLVASAALIAALTHQRLHDEIDQVGTAERQSRAALELSLGVRDLYAHQAHSIILGDRSHLDHYKTAQQQVAVLLDVIDGLVDDPSERAAITEVSGTIARLEANFDADIVPRLGGPPTALVAPHDRALALVEDIAARIDALSLRFRARADLAQRRADASHAAEIWFHLGLVLAAALFAAGVAVYLARAIARPLGDLQRGASRIARGDLTTRIPVPPDADLGALAAAFNTMAADLQRHARELVDAEKLASVGRVAAGIAHEINNPLAVIIGHARLLQKSPDLSLADDARRISLEAERCRDIVHDLLDLSRPPRLALAEVDLASVIGDVAEALTTAGTPCRVALDPTPPPSLALLPGDAKKLRQIMTNLLRNAAEAAPNEPITVAFTRSATHLVTRISDRGPGITAGIDLFEPFQTSKAGGTGLGLAVSRTLARAHGGELTFATGAPTTFELTLPLTPEPTS